MNNVAFGAVVPHGLSEIGPIAGKEKDLFLKTRNVMEALSKNIERSGAQTLVVLTPHGLRVKGYTSIYTCSHTSGTYCHEDHCEVLDFSCDCQLAKSILEEGEKRSLHVVGCNFGVSEGPLSRIEMDWGAFVPLWFLRHLQKKIQVVVICPSRDVDLQELERLGEIIARQIKNGKKSVGIIASADQGHCHLKDGPYGYNPASAAYDAKINEILKQDKLSTIMDVDLKLVEDARADSIWQMVVLSGAMKQTKLKGHFCSYEVPTYFGMSVCEYFADKM